VAEAAFFGRPECGHGLYGLETKKKSEQDGEIAGLMIKRRTYKV